MLFNTIARRSHRKLSVSCNYRPVLNLMHFSAYGNRIEHGQLNTSIVHKTDISNIKLSTDVLLTNGSDLQDSMHVESTSKSFNESEISLVERQLKLEEEVRMQALQDHSKVLEDLMGMGRGTGLKIVQRMFLEWYEPFVDEIKEEIKLIKAHNYENGRNTYGPFLLLLPPEKLAIITINTVLNTVLRSHNAGGVVSQMSIDISDIIQTEFVTIMKTEPTSKSKAKAKYIEQLEPDAGADTNKEVLKKDPVKYAKDWRTEMVKQLLEGGNVTKSILNRIKKLMDAPDWPKDLKVKLGSALIAMLLQTARHVSPATKTKPAEHFPALIHTTDFVNHSKSPFFGNKAKKLGLVRLDPALYTKFLVVPENVEGEKLAAGVIDRELSPMMVRHMPMLTVPRPWNNLEKSSPYLTLSAPMIRTRDKSQIDAVKHADMKPVLDSLNYISSTPWKVNRTLFDVINKVWDLNLQIGELPDLLDRPIPTEDEFYVDVVDYDASSPDPKHLRSYARVVSKIKQTNSELHSMRCDLKLKLWVAEKFLNEEKIYFPHNLDFRGRTYPIPPNLNHLGSDLARSLLLFSEGKPLGKVGYNWLKVHLANINGTNKMSRERRIQWVDDNIESVIDSALNPIDGSRWWSTAENPFQALATCIEIVEALRLALKYLPESEMPKKTKKPHQQKQDQADEIFRLIAVNRMYNSPHLPESREIICAVNAYVCNLPVHQDGSCNGLQHYAALGRDSEGGAAVNLIVKESEKGVKPVDSKPADVYSEVLTIVMRRIKEDSQIPPLDEIFDEETQQMKTDSFMAYLASVGDHSNENIEQKFAIEKTRRSKGVVARLVGDVVNRKVIKQTVMTSVYGVTAIGARLQVERQLEDLLFEGQASTRTREQDMLLFASARYVANLALDSLSEMFVGAKLIMDWLAKCAELVSKQGQSMSWVTPLGLAVMQPYRKSSKHVVKTILQNVVLSVSDDTLPVAGQRQRSAFPPNFVHSLDATHMMLTSLQMKEYGLTMAAVHDSYWTHPCDVPVMSEAIRSSFIELYSLPILEELHESLVKRYPSIVFPAVPERGELDINQVWHSPYFFH